MAKNKPSKNERAEIGHPFGIHRVLDKDAVLPQAAEKLDNTLPIYSNEILIKIQKLNIDAASFVQMEEETRKDSDKISQIVFENTLTRGKQHNRVTGSGGMLIGEIAQIGSRYQGPLKAKIGDRVATLVSLTLTPLHLEKIQSVDMRTHQLDGVGHAILFEKSIAALIPKDFPEKVAMAVYDVAGAPATVNALCKKNNTVLIIGGGGKAGVLSCVAARRKIGKAGKLFAIEPFPKAAEALRNLNVCNEVFEIDATNPTSVFNEIERVTRGKLADVVVNVASVPNTEIGSILSAKPKAKVLFFSMATSFTKVALGAEGVAASCDLIFGNGYYPNHAQFSLDLLRKNKALKELFLQRYK